MRCASVAATMPPTRWPRWPWPASTGAAAGAHAARPARIPGEPHRVEPVAIVNEVEYFDDSKGTNVGATLAACARPGRRPQAGRDPRRRRQGPGLQPAGRAAGPTRARGGADRPRRTAHPRAGAGSRRRGRCAAAGRGHPARGGARLRCRGPGGRRGADVAGLRQHGHVPTTTSTAPRCSSTPCANWRGRARRRPGGHAVHAAGCSPC